MDGELPLCVVAECGARATAKGYCDKHRLKLMRYGTIYGVTAAELVARLINAALDMNDAATQSDGDWGKAVRELCDAAIGFSGRITPYKLQAAIKSQAKNGKGSKAQNDDHIRRSVPARKRRRRDEEDLLDPDGEGVGQAGRPNLDPVGCTPPERPADVYAAQAQK